MSPTAVTVRVVGILTPGSGVTVSVPAENAKKTAKRAPKRYRTGFSVGSKGTPSPSPSRNFEG